MHSNAKSSATLVSLSSRSLAHRRYRHRHLSILLLLGNLNATRRQPFALSYSPLSLPHSRTFPARSSSPAPELSFSRILFYNIYNIIYYHFFVNNPVFFSRTSSPPEFWSTEFSLSPGAPSLYINIDMAYYSNFHHSNHPNFKQPYGQRPHRSPRSSEHGGGGYSGMDGPSGYGSGGDHGGGQYGGVHMGGGGGSRYQNGAGGDRGSAGNTLWMGNVSCVASPNSEIETNRSLLLFRLMKAWTKRSFSTHSTV